MKENVTGLKTNDFKTLRYCANKGFLSIAGNGQANIRTYFQDG